MTGHYLKIIDSNGDRIPVSAVAGAYEAASSGRRLSTWGTSTAGPNSAIFSSLSTLRARSRELTRNNPNAFAAIDSFVSNLIGTGITPRWQLEDSGLKKEIQQLWADWTEQADHAGACDFYGLQALAARAVIEAGVRVDGDVRKKVTNSPIASLTYLFTNVLPARRVGRRGYFSLACILS